MANTNFTVHNGLTVGPTSIDAATGNYNSSGNITTTGSVFLGSSLTYTPANGFLQIGSNANNYVQVAIQNASSGNNASTDIAAVANNGSDNDTYVDIGITSSTYNQNAYNLYGANDGYLIVSGNSTTQGGNLIINTYTAKDIIFATGGTLKGNEIARMRANTNSFVVTSSTTSTSNSTGALIVNGGAGIAGNLFVGGNISVAGNTFYVNTTIINTTDTLQAPTIITGSGGVYPNANASVNLGTTSAYWNNVYAVNFLGTSTTAKYADLAERYTSDADYEPGTVVDFGGTAEVTLSDIDGSQYVAGVVSTNPAYMMNSDADGLYIALTGRVPTKVTGPIEKGAMMVSNGDGTARMERNPKIGSVIGKALQSFGDGVGVIEVVVGRL